MTAAVTILENSMSRTSDLLLLQTDCPLWSSLLRRFVNCLCIIYQYCCCCSIVSFHLSLHYIVSFLLSLYSIVSFEKIHSSQVVSICTVNEKLNSETQINCTSWIYCLKHACVRLNKMTDQLADRVSLRPSQEWHNKSHPAQATGSWRPTLKAALTDSRERERKC